LKNLAAVLEAAGQQSRSGCEDDRVPGDMKEFAGMNEVYATFFSGPAAREATVAAAGLPRDARVEIEAVALGFRIKQPALESAGWRLIETAGKGSAAFRDFARLDAGCADFHPARATLRLCTRIDCRFGSNRRGVRLFACETLLPN
jgi:hypothetical protein